MGFICALFKRPTGATLVISRVREWPLFVLFLASVETGSGNGMREYKLDGRPSCWVANATPSVPPTRVNVCLRRSSKSISVQGRDLVAVSRVGPGMYPSSEPSCKVDGFCQVEKRKSWKKFKPMSKFRVVSSWSVVRLLPNYFGQLSRRLG